MYDSMTESEFGHWDTSSQSDRDMPRNHQHHKFAGGRNKGSVEVDMRDENRTKKGKKYFKETDLHCCERRKEEW